MSTTSMPAPSILPATAVLEMTGACNQACLFCSCPWYTEAAARPGEMPVAEWKELIAEYARAGVVNFCFTGGEALLKEGLTELIAYAAQVQARHVETVEGELQAWDAPPKLYLLSNGKAVTDDVLALCKAHGVALSLSLPGLDTFEAHTRGGQDASHVLSLFRKAKELGVTTTAGITVTARNMDELRETVALSLIAGADRVLINRFMPGGRGLANRDLELSREQVAQIPRLVDDVLRQAGRPGHIGTELPRCLVEPAEYERLKVGTRCAAATDFFVVGPSGQLRVCNHSPVDLVHWRDYDTLRSHPYWRRFVFKQWTPKGCEGCRALGTTCDGGCREAAHVANGSLDAADPVFRGEAPQPRSEP